MARKQSKKATRKAARTINKHAMRERFVQLRKKVDADEVNGQRGVIMNGLLKLGAGRKPVSNLRLVKAIGGKLEIAKSVTPEACVKAHLRLLANDKVVVITAPAKVA